MRLEMTTAVMTWLFAATTLVAAGAADKATTFTGKVGDAMCGVTHMVKGDDAKCTRLCVDGGAEYALIVRDQAYTLKANAAIKSELRKLADRQVTVTGRQSGRTIDVTSVRAGK